MIVSLRRSASIVLAACAASLALPALAHADAGQVIVRFAVRADAADRAAARLDAGVVRDRALPVSGVEVVDPRPGRSEAAAIAALERSPDVLYAERDAPRSADQLANDPRLPAQWGLAAIGAPAAWDAETGDRGVTVAVVDSGIEFTHADLAPNLWRNPGETPDGRDDDANGYVDDINGWDFVDGDALPADANGHGTHVAGTIAASGNDGVGVTGVTWRAGLMALRALDATGSGYTSDLVRAYAYAARNGARIVNASLGGSSYSKSEYDAIRAAKDVLFVVAAGNSGTDNDTNPSYPCAHDLPNVLCVAASDRDDALAPFSNYGLGSVDLAAPGVGILSTWLSGAYRTLSGTSMATPHVAGAAALVLAANPQLTTGQLRQTLVQTVDPILALEHRVASGGRLDVARAVAATVPPATAQPVPVAPDSPAALTPAPAPAPPASSPTPAPVPSPAPAVLSAVPAPAALPPPTPVSPGTIAAPAVTPLALTLRVTARMTMRAALASRLPPEPPARRPAPCGSSSCSTRAPPGGWRSHAAHGRSRSPPPPARFPSRAPAP